MKITVGISNRHVHLTKESIEILYGNNYQLSILKNLSQKGQFASKETVTIQGPKGSIDNIRVLGPCRKYNQVEISKTDSFKLGINPPVRNSGDLIDSSPITIIGPKGKIELLYGCIIATRHIHIPYTDLDKLKLKNNDMVAIKINGEKSAILNNVILKASDDATLELHLDTDDANANLINQGDEVEVLINEEK